MKSHGGCIGRADVGDREVVWFIADPKFHVRARDAEGFGLVRRSAFALDNAVEVDEVRGDGIGDDVTVGVATDLGDEVL